MEFRTIIEKQNPDFKINQNSKILTIGSCFSDVLGSYLQKNKMDCLINPFGVVFNLFSIANLLERTINLNEMEEGLILTNDEVFFHYDYHSENRSETKEGLIEIINLKQKEVFDFISKIDYLILTIGTSWVYQLTDNNRIVSNCHKQNSSLFKKRFLDLSDHLAIFEKIYFLVKNINPDLKIILTVSPVRHIKDTLTLNNLSKANLRLACDSFIKKFKSVYYFPAYEIMMDDLRDYRFYNSDLIHPNETAERYILDLFSQWYFDENLQEFIKEWQKINVALNHRPFNPKSSKHQEFLKKMKEKLKPYDNQIDTKKEMDLINQHLI
jgi:hypothetical protein